MLSKKNKKPQPPAYGISRFELARQAPQPPVRDQMRYESLSPDLLIHLEEMLSRFAAKKFPLVSVFPLRGEVNEKL